MLVRAITPNLPMRWVVTEVAYFPNMLSVCISLRKGLTMIFLSEM